MTLQPTPQFWQRFALMLDLVVGDGPRHIVALHEVLDVANHPDAVWLRQLDAEATQGDLAAMAWLLVTLFDGDAIHQGLQAQMADACDPLDPHGASRLSALDRIVEHVHAELGAAWNSAYDALVQQPAYHAFGGLWASLAALDRQLNWAGVRVAYIAEVAEIFSQPAEFAATHLHHVPLSRHANTPLSWSPIPMRPRQWLGAFRECVCDGLVACARATALANVSAALDRLDAHVSRARSVQVSRLDSPYSLSCCGSTQWLIEGAAPTAVVVQVFQYC